MVQWSQLLFPALASKFLLILHFNKEEVEVQKYCAILSSLFGEVFTTDTFEKKMISKNGLGKVVFESYAYPIGCFSAMRN